METEALDDGRGNLIPRQGTRLWLFIPWILLGTYIFAFAFNGLLDMPNHLARSHIMLECLLKPRTDICEHYQVTITLVPYVLSDLLLMAYLAILPPLLAEKVALFISLSLFLLGWYLLYVRVNGYPGLGYLAGLVLLLNNYLYNGFYAYLTSVALALLWLSYWWKSRHRETLLSQVPLALGLVIIFGIHLAGFLSAFLVYLLYEAQMIIRNRNTTLRHLQRRLLRTAPVLLPVPILYAAQQHLANKGLLSSIVYKPIHRKLATVFYPFINYSPIVDAIVIVGLITVLLLSIRRSQWVALSGSFWIVVSGAFFVLFLASPTSTYGVYDFDVRFLPLAYLAAFLGIGAVCSNRSIYATLLTALLVVHLTTHLYYKQLTNVELEKVADVLARVPEGKSLATISSVRNFPDETISRVSPFPYFGSYYQLRAGTLVSGLFDCRLFSHLGYFCYRDREIASLEHFRYQFFGLPKITDRELSKLGTLFEYILVLDRKGSEYVQGRFSSTPFKLIDQNDYVYLFVTGKGRASLPAPKATGS